MAKCSTVIQTICINCATKTWLFFLYSFKITPCPPRCDINTFSLNNILRLNICNIWKSFTTMCLKYNLLNLEIVSSLVFKIHLAISQDWLHADISSQFTCFFTSLLVTLDLFITYEELVFTVYIISWSRRVVYQVNVTLNRMPQITTISSTSVLWEHCDVVTFNQL